MCQAVTFNLSHHTAAAAGSGFSSYFCFDCGSIVTTLELLVHIKQGRSYLTALESVDHMFTISIGRGADGGLRVYGGWGNRSRWPLHTESHV